METEIDKEEIKIANFQIDNDSNLGSDGFVANLFKLLWEIINDKLVSAIRAVFDSGHIIKEINHTFVTLIPKKDNLISISNYRPISCCNVLYKIISNIICNRTKIYTYELISCNQNAFIPRRNINENSLLAYEMVRTFNRKRSNNLCPNVDLQKAYDKVNIEYVCHILATTECPYKIICIVIECVTAPTFSILINGSPCSFIANNRGLR